MEAQELVLLILLLKETARLTNSFSAQQIKRNLIEKAKIKKDYAKIKSRQATEPRPVGTVPDDEAAEPATTEINPERQVMIAETPEEQQKPTPRTEPGTRHKKSKPVPFAREHQQALWAKTEAEERRKARDEAEAQRQQKLEERERFRRAMAKARTGGKNGQRKLGRESKVLLEKVQRIVNES